MTAGVIGQPAGNNASLDSTAFRESNISRFYSHVKVFVEFVHSAAFTIVLLYNGV